MKKVSVIIPVYNEIDFLEECVNSLEKQTYSNLEFIFIDDCSTDGSDKFIDNFAKNRSNCKVIHHQENKCTYISRVDAFKICEGDYITFLDGDDTLPSDYVEKLVENMEKSDADICIADIVEIYPKDDRRNILSKSRLNKIKSINLNIEENCFFNIFNKMLNEKYFVLWCKMISKRLLEKCLPEFEEFLKDGEGISYGEDFIFSTILYFYSQKVINTHDTNYNYKFHDKQSIVFNGEEKYKKQIISFLKSAKRIKVFLGKHNIFNEYKQYYDKWLHFYKSLLENEGFKYRQIKVFREVIKEYDNEGL